MSGVLHKSFISQHKTLFKYIFIPFFCLSSIGNMYCYFIPGAIQSIIKRDLNINSRIFMELYTWYSVPNIFLCFVGSFVVDRYTGLSIGGIVCILFLIVGQIIFASGGFIKQIWLMNLGRVIFGMGGETLFSVTNSFAALWFKGGELNFVFSLQLSFRSAMITSSLKSMSHVYYSAGKIHHGNGQLGIALYFATLTCVMSLICWIVMAVMTKYAKKHNIINIESGLGETYPVSLKDVFHFGTPFWLISLIFCTYFIAIIPFIGIALSYLQLKYQLDSDYANTVISMFFNVSAIASPVFGFVIYKTGRNLTWLVSSIILGILATFMFTFSFIPPIKLMIIWGINFSFFAPSLWPLVVYIVPPTHLTTAYGTMQAAQSLGFTLAPLIVGTLVDHFGYFAMELFFIGCLYCAFLGTVALFFCLKKTPILNANSRDIRIHLNTS